ncbi:MAG: M23 family metallopeptidase [Alistipes sp.]|nr:M23 family metallopeptidase [Alistipes sp.]
MERNTDTNSSRRQTSGDTYAGYRLRTYRLLRKALVGFILVSIVNVAFSYFFYTPKMYAINRDNRELEIKYDILRDRISAAQRKISEIKHRDNYVYRSLFAVDTISVDGVYAPYPDSKYEELEGDLYTSVMVPAWRSLDDMARRLYLESVSLDELQQLSRNKEQLSTAIPAVWPIDRTRLKSIDHFGWRTHPLYRRTIFHKGIDLGCDVGNVVFATGDAVVESIDTRSSRVGYGRQILLDHGFGYKTRYAHLNKVLVKPGDKVVRGQVIGESGRSGGVTGPHLHYEVLRAGQPVNPINYFDRNMTPEEYIDLMENIRQANLEKFDTANAE